MIVILGVSRVSLILRERVLSLHLPVHIRLRLWGHNNILLLPIVREPRESIARLVVDTSARDCSVIGLACLTVSLGQFWDSLTRMTQIPKALQAPIPNHLLSHHPRLHHAPSRLSPTTGYHVQR